MNNMETLLRESIENELDKLGELSVGTKEHSAAVDDLTKLMDRRIELEKLAVTETQEEKRIREERYARWTKNLIDLGLGLGGLALTYWGAKASFRFEESGTITSQTGKKFWDRVFRK